MPQLARQNTHQNNAHIHRNRLQPKPATPFALCSAMLLLLGMALLASCSSERSAALSSRPVKLTARAADVLGFESAADWQGMQRTNAAHTQGAASGEVVVNGWTQISSVPLSRIASPGEVLGAEAFLDVRLPQSVHWGEVRLIVEIPSRGIWWRDIGGTSLTSLPVGQFGAVSFQIPPDVQAALNSTYADLRFIVVVNGPSMSGPVLLDNLRLASTGGDTGVDSDSIVDSTSTDTSTSTASDEADSEIPGTIETFVIKIPEQTIVRRVLLSATESLQVNDRVVLGDLNSPDVVVSSFNGGGTEFGAAMAAYGSLYSTGDVFLRSSTLVRGFVQSQGSITKQNDVDVQQGERPHTTVTESVRSWQVRFPSIHNGDVHLEPDNAVSMRPGSWHDVVVKSRSTIVLLESGDYFFNSLRIEPEGKIYVRNAGGPVRIYVRESVNAKGPLISYAGPEGHLLLAYLGTETLSMEAPMTGSIVAPNAKIELRRPNTGIHRGSFFAKSIEVFSDVPVQHLEFPWHSLLEPELDPDDECPADPNKFYAGICGCGRPETDNDGDGVPDCKDECPFDPNKTEPGDCGCLGSPEGIKEGAICRDAPCPGVGVCDATGQCIVDNDCAPAPGCFARYFEKKLFWFCEGEHTWEEAQAKCTAVPGRALAEVKLQNTNLFLNNVLRQKQLTSPFWIGANDRNNEGQWHWITHENTDGLSFWSGGADGHRVSYRYEAWQRGQAPDGGASENCALLTATDNIHAGAVWDDAGCATHHGFICWEYRSGPTPHPKGGLTTIWDTIPGLNLEQISTPTTWIPGQDEDGDGYEDNGDGDCVEIADVFGDMDYAAFEAFTQECDECNNKIAEENRDATLAEVAERCAVECSGPMAVPAEDSRCRFGDDDYLATDPPIPQAEQLPNRLCDIVTEYAEARCNQNMECVSLTNAPWSSPVLVDRSVMLPSQRCCKAFHTQPG